MAIETVGRQERQKRWTTMRQWGIERDESDCGNGVETSDDGDDDRAGGLPLSTTMLSIEI
jgi:hypothetical protein